MTVCRYVNRSNQIVDSRAMASKNKPYHIVVPIPTDEQLKDSRKRVKDPTNIPAPKRVCAESPLVVAEVFDVRIIRGERA